MDMHNETTMASYEVRAECIGCKTVVGAKQVRKAICSGKARRVYLAHDADPAITEPLEALCRQNRIGVAWVRTMKDLGQSAGIEVGAVALATLNIT